MYPTELPSLQDMRSNTIRITSREYKNYEATLRRMCNRSAKRGTLQVSDDVAERWKNTKSRKQLIVALINCQGDKVSLQHIRKHVHGVDLAFVCMHTQAVQASQDAFNQRMEVVIRNIKEGKVVIDSGYYSEAAMKNELGFDKQLSKTYCSDLFITDMT